MYPLQYAVIHVKLAFSFFILHGSEEGLNNAKGQIIEDRIMNTVLLLVKNDSTFSLRR